MNKIIPIEMIKIELIIDKYKDALKILHNSPNEITVPKHINSHLSNDTTEQAKVSFI